MPRTTTNRSLPFTFTLTLAAAVAGLAGPAAAGGDGDCNGNGVPDDIDVIEGSSADLNGDFVPDECQVGIRIEQVSWLGGADGGFVERFSNWGRLEVLVRPETLSLMQPHPEGGFQGFLSVAFPHPDGFPIWVVRNYPMYVEGDLQLPDLLPRMLDIPLPVPDGMPMDMTDAFVRVTPDALPFPPQLGLIHDIPVPEQPTLFGGLATVEEGVEGSTGIEGPWLIDPVPWDVELAIPALTVCKRKRIVVRDADIAAIDEEENGCSPAGVARSLDYLDQQSDAFDLPAAQSIYEGLRDAMGTSVGADGYGTYLDGNNPKGQRGILGGKQDYLIAQGIANKIRTTTSTNMAEVAECLENGADVELNVYWGRRASDNKNLGAHTAMVVGMRAVKDAEGTVIGWIVDIIDDRPQGDGTASNTVTPLGFLATGELVNYGVGARLKEFIVEKLVDEENTCSRVSAKIDDAAEMIDAFFTDPPTTLPEWQDRLNDVIVTLMAARRQLDAIMENGSDDCLPGAPLDEVHQLLGEVIDELIFLKENLLDLEPDQVVQILQDARATLGQALGLLFGPPPCPADFDGNGAVEFNDLVQLLSVWGPCTGCPEDLDHDGQVGFGDLVILLSAWGECD